MILNYSLLLMFVGCILYAMISDFLYLKIPNWISIALVIVFIFYAVFSWPDIKLTEHLIIGASVFCVTFVLFLLNSFGAGDVKFLSALSLWTNAQQFVPFIMLVAILGGVIALMIISMRLFLKLKPDLGSNNILLKKLRQLTKSGAMPYGIPIGLAALIVIPRALIE